MPPTPPRTPRIPVDLLLHARYVLPIAPQNGVLEDHTVVIDQGRIKALRPRKVAELQFEGAQARDFNHHVIMPGLVNAHGHLAMTLLRGLGEGEPLQTWLQDTIWPLEGKWVDADFVADGTRLAIAEMLATGTTLASDMYYFPEVAAATTQEIGFRLQVAFPVIDVANAWSQNVDECIHKGLALHDRFRDDELVHVAFGPHAAYSVDEPTLRRVLMLAEEVDAGIQIHLHETAAEVRDAHRSVGKSWIHYLNELGLVTPRLQAVHVTQADSQEVEVLANGGAHVIHCPHSNLKLASGTCPTMELLAAGVNVALGTDGAASNNSLDLFLEMRTAALIAKASTQDPTAAAAPEMLHAATLGGAKALGLDRLAGSIETGKAADLIAIDLDHIALQPLYDLQAQLVHSQIGACVSHTFVDGRCLYDEGTYTTIDVKQLAAGTAAWRTRIADT